MEDYEIAWQRMTDHFWRSRHWELFLHLALFVLINAPLIADANGLSLVATAPDFLRTIGIDNIPWLTIHWATLLMLHILVVASAALWIRVFHAGIMHEFSQRHTPMKAKRKNQLTLEIDEEGWFDEAANRPTTIKREKS